MNRDWAVSLQVAGGKLLIPLNETSNNALQGSRNSSASLAVGGPLSAGVEAVEKPRSSLVSGTCRLHDMRIAHRNGGAQQWADTNASTSLFAS
jgi:hypothetical protein